MTHEERSLELHKKLKGKIALLPKVEIRSREDLSWAYTPGVAAPCLEIAKDAEKVWDYTSRGNWVAVVSDGSAVLGLGNIGPLAGLPVMEGKAILFKSFANIDAFPIILNVHSVDEIVQAVKAIAPSFGGINLEDIAAPQCFDIEERLKAELDIPVFHDDQHGTAIVVLAGLMNAAKVTGRQLQELKVTICGAGAAGVAIANILYNQGVRDLIAVDRKGMISRHRSDLNGSKQRLLKITQSERQGSLEEAVRGRDVFIGVSGPGLLTEAMIRTMNPHPIVFAMANPLPEIMPEQALKAGAAIVATGRSDFPNQINNVLAFPGVFRGALDRRSKTITEAMKIAAAHALAATVPHPSPEHIIPDPLDRTVVQKVAAAVRSAS